MHNFRNENNPTHEFIDTTNFFYKYGVDNKNKHNLFREKYTGIARQKGKNYKETDAMDVDDIDDVDEQQNDMQIGDDTLITTPPKKKKSKQESSYNSPYHNMTPKDLKTKHAEYKKRIKKYKELKKNCNNTNDSKQYFDKIKWYQDESKKIENEIESRKLASKDNSNKRGNSKKRGDDPEKFSKKKYDKLCENRFLGLTANLQERIKKKF